MGSAGAWRLTRWIRLAIAATGLAVVLFVKPVESRESGPGRVAEALRILSGIPSGQALLGRAVKFWGLARSEDLVKVFKWGAASKTDAVLTRHYDPRTGTEHRDRQVTIFLRQSQSLEALVLDIAHELVHATSRPSWDPYDPGLTAGKYIRAAIEGEGGEVDAVVSECQVSLELTFDPNTSTNRCQSYVGKTTAAPAAPPKIDRDQVKRDFYRVGEWSEDLVERLGEEAPLFPMLTSLEPRLYSSTGHAPYPVALFREFEEINQMACDNSRKRVSMAGALSGARSPASANSSGTNSSGTSGDGMDGARTFLAQRCR